MEQGTSSTFFQERTQQEPPLGKTAQRSERSREMGLQKTCSKFPVKQVYFNRILPGFSCACHLFGGRCAGLQGWLNMRLLLAAAVRATLDA